MALKESCTDMRKNSKLVVISIPLTRIARSSLSNAVLDPLRQEGDVLIVSPFSDEPGFQKDFAGPNTHFLQWNPEGVSKLKALFLAVPEMMRRLGYWRRFRNNGLLYYVKNQYVSFGDEGQDKRFGPLRWLIYWLLSFWGQFPKAWQFVEKFYGKSWYAFPELTQFVREYKHVTLIQSANWGMQDRALARLSRQQTWRKVLLPYTTDQLFTNGFLLNDFDAVCVQGPFELTQAREFHHVTEDKIYKLGSAWFRQMEYIKSLNSSSKAVLGKSRKIIYAGVSSTYFPSKSELQAVDALVEYIRKRGVQNGCQYELLYRPVIFNDALKDVVKKRYERHDIVKLQWPAPSAIGLNQYAYMDQENSLREYVSGIADCELLIMSYLTSFCKDVAFLESCGVISNMIDSDGILARRHNDLFPTYMLPGVKLIHSIEELLEAVEYFLGNPQQAAQNAKGIISMWDYPAHDFSRILKDAVYQNVGLQHTSVAA